MVSDLAPALAPFLRDYVSGYEELEALLLLATEPTRDWTAAAIAQSLNVPEDAVVGALERLISAGDLVAVKAHASVKSYAYAPARQDIRERVAELIRAYGERRMDIVQMMTKNAMDRARNTAARYLADAFLFERRKK